MALKVIQEDSECRSCGSCKIDTTFLKKDANQSHVSIFDVFKISLGPSSQYTTGPMRAAHRFVQELKELGILSETGARTEMKERQRCRHFRVKIEFYGSLATIGRKNRADVAAIAGLYDYLPETIAPDEVDNTFAHVTTFDNICLGRQISLPFTRKRDIVWHPNETWSDHPTGMTITLMKKDMLDPSTWSRKWEHVHQRKMISTERGDVYLLEEWQQRSAMGGSPSTPQNAEMPYDFRSCAELLEICKKQKLSIAEVCYANEMAVGCCDRATVDRRLDALLEVMFTSIERGMHASGKLPLKGTKRLSKDIYAKLSRNVEGHIMDHLIVLDWISLYARAVNEENAASGRVVSAPTCSSSGTLPAVIYYFHKFHFGVVQQALRDMLATAGVVGSLIMRNASVDGKEAGCQAEVGSACAMAAAALAAVKGASPEQVENAAEIALEHWLGTTCDPVEDVVVVPCIERNAVASTNAVTAARLALLGNGKHFVSFDACVNTMYQCGIDIQAKYHDLAAEGILALHARDPRGRKPHFDDSLSHPDSQSGGIPEEAPDNSLDCVEATKTLESL